MTNGAGSDIVADFRMGLDLMRRHPVLAAPPLIAMAAFFLVVVIFFGGTMTMFAAGGMMGGGRGMAGAMVGGVVLFFALWVVMMLVHLVASAVVIVMARDALAGRAPSMGDALGVVLSKLSEVVLASVVVVAIVAVASIFLVIPGLIAAFFLMFTLPAVLLEGRGALDSLSRSARLVKDNVGSVIGLVIGAIVALVVGLIAQIILGVVPVLGHLASMLLSGAFVAYLTVVGVRVFQTLPRR